MDNNESFSSDTVSKKRNQFKCFSENCNNPVTHLLISIHVNVNGATCDSCKEDDRITHNSYAETTLKINDKEGKRRNTKNKEDDVCRSDVVDAYGQPSVEFDVPIMEWVQID